MASHADRAKPRSMIVAGVMSGTSADGVDVALVRISPGRGGLPRLKILGHRGFPYPARLRTAILRVMNGGQTTAAELSRLDWQLGAVYAGCVEASAAALMPASGSKLALIGLHGQTVFHEGGRATWQMGEPAVLREKLGVPVVSDFRAADIAAGGQGAPLVPMFDFCMFRSETIHRVMLNLGGIANVTVIPARAELGDITAFDTGPANMVVDGLMAALYGKRFDREGRTAARGHVLESVVAESLRMRFFRAAPPKSCGREEFGEAFVQRFRDQCLAAGGSKEDTVATATELTTRSIAEAYQNFCKGPGPAQLFVSGGGTQNAWMMQRLREQFTPLGVKVLLAEDLGVGAQAKEAVAFALLAWLSYHGSAGNVPGATGARRAVALGKVTS